MKKTNLTQTRIGEDEIRYALRLESEPCPADTQLARFLKFELLRDIAQDPTVTQCGNNDFQTMSFKHDGERWIVSLEAIVKGGTPI